jgi:hypothetical protein
MQIKTLGIDLGKTACDVVAMDGCGKVVARRRSTRPKLIAWLAESTALTDRPGGAGRRPPSGAPAARTRPRGALDGRRSTYGRATGGG